MVVAPSSAQEFSSSSSTATPSAASPSSPPASDATEQAIAVDACGPRIRKSWDRLSPVEKDVYLRAIALAMDDGLYIRFVELHAEQMTTMEAHRTCMFVYWHRLMLLGFENMLRAYGGEFACLTVPYWNYVDHNALFLAGACRSLEDCAPILRELGGGSAPGITRTVTVNGTPVQGRCVAAAPLDHFCESALLSGPQCARCVPRGDWRRAAFPGTTSVASLLRQLFSSPTIDGVSTNLEQGVHSTSRHCPAEPPWIESLIHLLFCLQTRYTTRWVASWASSRRRLIPSSSRTTRRSICCTRSSTTARSETRHH
ncbi:hypothetical protein PINS_up001816 [Pythium insidiosum]|nr:hypothetical protein PINS_up001816 [Pythium insidiosum]